MQHRLAPQAEADIDEAWLYVASTGNIEAAERLVDLLTNRFLALVRFPPNWVAHEKTNSAQAIAAWSPGTM